MSTAIPTRISPPNSIEKPTTPLLLPPPGRSRVGVMVGEGPAVFVTVLVAVMVGVEVWVAVLVAVGVTVEVAGLVAVAVEIVVLVTVGVAV